MTGRAAKSIPIAARVPGRPTAPLHHVVRGPRGTQVLVVPHSRLFDVDDAFARDLEAGEVEATAWLREASLTRPGEDALDLVPTPAPQSISLNASSSCNLSCGYCYAARGSFGGAQSVTMDWPVARAAVDRLLDVADRAAPVTIGFLGGEPFANRSLIHRVVDYTSGRAAREGIMVRFAVTTNGTLLDDSDRDLLRAHGFAVTVSVDGARALHDQQRPSADGGSAFDRMAAGVGPLVRAPGNAKVAARATVTRRQLDVGRSFDAITGVGFQEVGFSPLRGSPADAGGLREEDWQTYLDGCVRLGRRELAAVAAGGAEFRFSNLAVALKQIHRGASAPYPCGAGGGYFSVDATGDWYACHRAIGDRAFAMGDSSGLNDDRRAGFLAGRHVHAKTACGVCWARYLCSGACHQEAPSRTDAGCDFIRGWLEFCLVAYGELLTDRPDWFVPAAKEHVR